MRLVHVGTETGELLRSLQAREAGADRAAAEMSPRLGEEPALKSCPLTLTHAVVCTGLLYTQTHVHFSKSAWSLLRTSVQCVGSQRSAMSSQQKEQH